jgi:hypothetical protein
MTEWLTADAVIAFVRVLSKKSDRCHLAEARTIVGDSFGSRSQHRDTLLGTVPQLGLARSIQSTLDRSPG